MKKGEGGGDIVAVVIKLVKSLVGEKLDLFTHCSVADEAPAIWENF